MTGCLHLFIAQVRHTRPVKLVQLTEAEISALCHFCRQNNWWFFGGSLFLDEGGDELREIVAMISWNYLFGEKNRGGGGGFGVFFEKILECDSTVLFRLKVRCFSEKASYWIMVCWEHVDFRFSYGAQLEETARWISRFETRAPI